MCGGSLRLSGLWVCALLACSNDERREDDAEVAGGAQREGQVAGSSQRVSEADWFAATAPRSGTHEVWSAACNGERIGQEYRVTPMLGCYPRYDANNVFSQVRDCRIEDHCQGPADCNAEPLGICQGFPFSACDYPGSDEGKSCERDDECSFRPGGSCRPMVGGGESNCYPTGECREVPLLGCSYPYTSDCRADADCNAAPGGLCKLGLHTECAYNECQVDSDCGPRARCDCQGVRHCVAAQCFSAEDCGGLACEASRGLQCPNLSPGVGYFCRTAQDECRSDDDCAAACAESRTTPPCGSSCVYDAAVSHWACRGELCFRR